MMKQFTLRSLFFFLVQTTFAQVVNTASMDTSELAYQGKVTWQAYVDTYYAYNVNRPAEDHPYYVSMSRHNEFNINLAFIDVRYSSHRLRARFVPGVGTYVNANYVNENGSLKNIVEANAGFRPFSQKAIWIDAGVLGSPFTNESAISKDQLAYTRSLAAENVPYYLAGLKFTVPLTSKVNTYVYIVNGWQQIVDQNGNKAICTQLEIRPNEKVLINWNTFVGKERTTVDSISRRRFFSDVYMIYSGTRFSATACGYIGVQQNRSNVSHWWQINGVVRYRIATQLSVSGRIEYFDDRDAVLVSPVTGAPFKTSAASLGINFSPAENALLRAELKGLYSENKVYMDRMARPSQSSVIATMSLCAWF